MASRPPVSDSSGIIPPSVDPEVALLLTNEETLCEKAITLLLKISSSIVQQPNEKRVRSLNLASRAMELTLLPAHGAFELLFFMGFQEANDRLVMPDDACLETVKMYQQQLHQLLNWKTSSSSGGSTMPALDAALLSPASLHSPASVRSNTPKSTPRSTAKENQAVDRKRLSSGESAGSKSGRSPSRVTAASVASSKNTSASLSTRGELPASVSSKKDAPRKKDIQASSLTRQQSCGSTSNVVNVPNPSINSNKSGSGTEGSSAVLKNGNLKNPGTASGKLPSGSSPSTSSSSRPPVPQTSTSCVKTPSRASPSISSQPSSSAQPSLLAFKASPQQIVSKAGGAKASDTASRSSSSSHASASTGGSSSSGSSSMASSVMTPVSSVSTTSGSTVTAAATGATSKKLSPYKLRPHQRWLSRFRGYLERVLTYENHMHQAKARSLMPVARLHSAASAALKADAAARKEEHKADANARAKETSEKSTKPFDFNDYLLLELTSWFKRDFFRWFDCGWCSACRCNMASKSTVPPTKHELEGEANTVEYYQCQTCGADRRFPRYLNVGRLLETREGRCGEWASCFTLCCRTLGFDARQVFDETDHTWTEVWSHSQSRWVHVDPCEGRVDCPLLYECGWGKALSYVTAVSRDEVIDVTWRYTLQPNEVKKRRDKVSEEELWQHLWGLTVQLQQQHQQHTRHQLHLRMAREMASFFSPARTPTKAELEGRSSGSLGWRVSRGETGVLQTTSHHTFTLHHTARITTLTVKYNPVRDSYLCEGTVGPAMLQGWQSGVHTAANLAIKREHDWHNVYIARTEELAKPLLSRMQ